MDRRGRATGEAFVQFESQDDTEQALGRNREKIGHRWVSYTSYLQLQATTSAKPNIQHSMVKWLKTQYQYTFKLLLLY